ncbi:MAG: high frequency lysogenization protein [Dinoroseobacter sp.]|jgi:high frequency lysogenization protein
MIYEKRALALAGLVQAVNLVVSAAKTGMISQDSLDKSLKSIFVQNPGSIAEVYGGTRDITPGLNLLKKILNNFDSESHADLVRYSLAVISLERAFVSQPDKLRALGAEIERIDQLRMQSAYSAEDVGVNEEVVTQLAEAYEQIVGQVQPRIKISGNRSHLQNTSNVKRIRALLLSALRSAVLFHQVGGRRWQLLLKRGSYKAALTNYI